jgi:hypothetical protein
MVLAHYGFEPLWTTPDGNLTRDLVSFAYRIPYSPDLRLVELQSPRGVVAAEHVAASPPQVHVTNAVRRGGTLWVSWRSTPGTLASVLLSSDGQIWDSYRFETPNRSTTLTGIPRGPLHVKVIVTNGSRSGSAVVMTP